MKQISKIEKMFSYKSKLMKKLDEDIVKRYKKLYEFLIELQSKGVIPRSEDYLQGNELASNIYQRKYYLKDEKGENIDNSPEDVFTRVASFLAAMEETEEKQKEYAIRFYMYLYEGRIMPGGRVIAGAGDLFRLKTLANCFVSMLDDDNIESIYKAAYEAARTYSYGGGIGIDISVLRPKEAVVHNAANKSSGAVSFMDLYSLTTGLIGQEGRRGALMITIDVKHPDVIDFIKVKKNPNWTTKQIVEQLKWSGMFSDAMLKEIEKAVAENTQVRFANISVKISDEFMRAVEEENEYGKNKILLYKKKIKGKVERVDNIVDVHYSLGMPSKDISHYELEEVFDDIDSLNSYLKDKYNVSVKDGELNDINKRDVYGDYVVELHNKDYDLAIKYAGDFLLYFSSPHTNERRELVKARDIWDLFVESNYKTAEPGLIYWSRMSKYSPSNYIGIPIVTTNPCGEVPLEDGGSCNLGSINLSRVVKNPYTKEAEIDFNALREATSTLTRILDNVTSWNVYLNPLQKQREISKNTRRIGIGVMGIADMLNQLMIGYDSEEGLKVIDEVMRTIANEAYRTSALLAKEKGPAPAFNYEKYSKNPFFKEVIDKEVKELIKQNGLRNIALLSIAPTGTISNIVLGFEHNGKRYIGVSGGVEPIFALYYTRRSESFDKFFKVFHSTVQAYIDMYNLGDKVEKAEDEESLKSVLPDFFFRTAHNIDPYKRIEIQAICQRYVDHSISSTINLPEDIEPEIISEIYIEGWRKGLKGVTIYRDGSRYPILTVEGKETEFQRYKDKLFKIISSDGEEIIVRGDDVISLPNGRLTTIYHAMKSGEVKGLEEVEEE